jgi:peptidoglycan hydrolase CwlO-like protein
MMNKLLLLSVFMAGYIVNDGLNTSTIAAAYAATTDPKLSSATLAVYNRILALEQHLQQHHEAFTESQTDFGAVTTAIPAIELQISDVAEAVADVQSSLNILENNLIRVGNNVMFIRSNCRYRPGPTS